jgi:hypothetical protein
MLLGIPANRQQPKDCIFRDREVRANAASGGERRECGGPRIVSPMLLNIVGVPDCGIYTTIDDRKFCKPVVGASALYDFQKKDGCR